MKVFVNGQQQNQIVSVESLKDLIEELRLDCKKTKKVIEVIINDRYIDDLNLIPLDPSVEVKINIKSSLETVIESMVESVSYLSALCESLEYSANFIQQGSMEKGINLFTQCIDGLDWVNHLLTGIRIYILEKDDLIIDTAEYLTSIIQFNPIVKELLAAWSSEDHVLVSDLIEYELIPFLRLWHKNITTILDRLAEVKD